MTIGTLRFEEGFYNMRNSIFTTGPDLPRYLEHMQPMFAPQIFPGSKKPKIGKFSFPAQDRINIFRFIIQEIRKYSNCPIALCKESAQVWQALGMDETNIQCVCQL